MEIHLLWLLILYKNPLENKFDSSESCPESCAGRIFARTNIRLNGARF